MGTHPYTVLDVFTDARLAGNALAVVGEADGLDEETMQRFARETRLAETTFVQSPTADGADYRNRIFTVVEEVPFAGHPSLGTAVAVARSRGERDAGYVQQTAAGLQPVEVRATDGGTYASVLQEPATFRAEVDPDPVMAALGLDPAAAHRRLRPQVVSTGLPTLVALVADAESVRRAFPRFEAIDALLGPLDAQNLYIAHHDPAAGRARARMFSRLVVEGEDPGTGSAAGPLCAYLAERGVATRVEIAQGVEIERPSRLVAQLEGERVRVGGDVVVVIEGRVSLP